MSERLRHVVYELPLSQTSILVPQNEENTPSALHSSNTTIVRRVKFTLCHMVVHEETLKKFPSGIGCRSLDFSADPVEIWYLPIAVVYSFC